MAFPPTEEGEGANEEERFCEIPLEYCHTPSCLRGNRWGRKTNVAVVHNNNNGWCTVKIEQRTITLRGFHSFGGTYGVSTKK